MVLSYSLFLIVGSDNELCFNVKKSWWKIWDQTCCSPIPVFATPKISGSFFKLSNMWLRVTCLTSGNIHLYRLLHFAIFTFTLILVNTRAHESSQIFKQGLSRWHHGLIELSNSWLHFDNFTNIVRIWITTIFSHANSSQNAVWRLLFYFRTTIWWL